jgi:hypothetical protein
MGDRKQMRDKKSFTSSHHDATARHHPSLQHTVETAVDAVTFPWAVPEVVNHRDPVTAFFP